MKIMNLRKVFSLFCPAQKGITASALLACFLLGGLAVLLPGCQPAPAERGQVLERENDGFPKLLVDYAGRNVRFAKPPSAYISTQPANTEILFALGLGSRVKAVTVYCDYPPEMKEMGLAWAEIDREMLGEMVPGLVLGGAGQELMAEFAGLVPGLAYFILDPRTYEEVAASIILVGEIADCVPEASAIASGMLEMKEKVRQRAAGVRDSERPEVLVLAVHEELRAAGRGTLPAELLELAGGKNAAEAGEGFQALGEAELLELDPEMIIFISPWEQFFSEKSWPQELQAFQQDSIYEMESALLNRPGPRLAEGLAALFDLLHGEKNP